MKSKLPLLGILLAVFVVGGAVWAVRRNAGDSAVTARGLKRAPAIRLPRGTGETLDTSQWKDEVIVVHFWAAWCPPCIPEIPEILSAAKKLPKDQAGRAIHWVLVSQDPSWEKANSIIRDEALPENVSLVLDPEAKVSDAFGSYQFPETYLIGRDGGVVAKWIGPQGWSGKWGDQALVGVEKLSRENAVSNP